MEKLAVIHSFNLREFFSKVDDVNILRKSFRKSHIHKFKCAEYSAEFQSELLLINEKLPQPVLDIGCGERANLVKHLRDNNVNAFGIDRLVKENDYLIKANWMNFVFPKQTYGTIISHMAFSNHFLMHHLNNNSDCIEYAQKYMEIISALQPGGLFIYAPGLPFIEKHLPINEFLVRQIQIDTNKIETKITNKEYLYLTVVKKKSC